MQRHLLQGGDTAISFLNYTKRQLSWDLKACTLGLPLSAGQMG